MQQDHQSATVFANKRTGVHKIENVPRQRKRLRAEESGPTTVKASKFRRSNTSAVISNCAAAAAAQTATGASKNGRSVLKLPKSTSMAAGSQVQVTLPEAFTRKTKTAASESLENDNNNKFTITKENRESGLTNKENILLQLPPTKPVSMRGKVLERLQSSEIKTAAATPITLATATTTTTATTCSNSSILKYSSLASTTTGGTTTENNNNNSEDKNLNSVVIFSADRHLLSSRVTASCLRYDTASYGQDWVIHYKVREDMFQPWQLALQGKAERLRLAVIQCYWESMKTHHTAPATIFIAINNFARLLNFWDKRELDHPCLSKWALTTFVAYRLAFKTEERPEMLCEVSNFWNVFPIFSHWEIDRSDRSVNQVESQALKDLNDSLDVPLAPMFLSQYISAARWPKELAQEYHELGLYLVSLATFASTSDLLLRNVVPSKLAAASLALSVKIANGDRVNGQGLVKHLPTCFLCELDNKRVAGYCDNNSSSQNSSDNNNNNKYSDIAKCICRYEFWPLRLETYTGLTYEELQPVVQGLSGLLRSRPPETVVLNHFFPLWGDNEWQ